MPGSGTRWNYGVWVGLLCLPFLTTVQGCGPPEGDAKLTPPEYVGVIVQQLKKCPRWVDIKGHDPDDLKRADEIVRTMEEIRHFPLKDVRKAMDDYLSFVRGNGLDDYEGRAQLHVLNVYLFAVPEWQEAPPDVDVENNWRTYKAGWLGVPYNRFTREWYAIWPLSFRTDGTMALTGVHKGYWGVLDPLRSFDSLREHFGRRVFAWDSKPIPE